MRITDQLLRDKRAHDRRVDAAHEAMDALTKEERTLFVAELIERIEKDGVKGARRRRTDAPHTATTPEPDSKRSDRLVDRAEAMVLKHLGGVTAEQVAGITGQNERSAYSTLSYIARKRGTITSDKGVWTPTGKMGTPTKKILRDHIRDVMVPGKVLGTNAIFVAVRKVVPDANKGSVSAEVMRMKQDGILVERPNGGRWPDYTLANGGNNRAA